MCCLSLRLKLFHFLSEKTSGSCNLHLFENFHFHQYGITGGSVESVGKVFNHYINFVLSAVPLQALSIEIIY
jgi:hypothetical protein